MAGAHVVPVVDLRIMDKTSDLNTTIVVRQWSGRVGTGIALAAALLVVVNETVHGGPVRGLMALAPMALLSYLVWLWWGSASMVLDAEGVHIRNPLHRADIGWQRVEGASGAWGLNVMADGRKHSVWACPARGGASMSRGGHPEALPSLFGPERTTTTTTLDAQRGSRLVQECRLEVAGSPGHVGGSELTTGWQVGRSAVLVALVAATAVALV